MAVLPYIKISQIAFRAYYNYCTQICIDECNDLPKHTKLWDKFEAVLKKCCGELPKYDDLLEVAGLIGGGSEGSNSLSPIQQLTEFKHSCVDFGVL